MESNRTSPFTKIFSASQYIHRFNELQAETKVVLCVRVSSHLQEKSKNLDDQEWNLREQAGKAGLKVVGVVDHVGSGVDPIWLVVAAEYAREHDAVLLAETVDRYIRHPGYHSVDNPEAQARKTDLEWLTALVMGIQLYTHLDPDATPGEVRAYQIERGQRMKNNKGGRPKGKKVSKKQRREELQGKAVELRRQGCSLREIARRLQIAHSTIHNWLSGFAKQFSQNKQ